MTPDRPLALIAEDEAIASMALRAQLDALGYDVLGPARDGEEAVNLGSCFPVDIAIFDQRMPRHTGIEAAARLFDDAPTPVLLLTGFSGADLPDPIPRPPIFATLTKPAGLAELEAGLDRARSAFLDWTAADPDMERDVRRSRDDRTLIARAVRAHAGDDPLSASAAAFVQRARQEGLTLVDLARRVLQEATRP